MEHKDWPKSDILFALHETTGIGQRTILKILSSGRLRDCPSFRLPEWTALGLSPQQTAAVLLTMKESFIRERKALYDSLGITCLSVWDERYPAMLKEIADPPWFLYARGNLNLLKNPAVAMVGTRVPTAYGRHTAEGLAESLSRQGVCIVSGLAKGIDTRAHEGGLRGGGSTIAVLGTPVNVIYPPENTSLYRSISEKGLLLSEYPHGTASRPGLFPQRNRIIAGLTHGTVVVEAAAKSGSLITADLALGYNREVYAVPGPISSPKSTGTNDLIRQGAKLITSATDILQDLNVPAINGSSTTFDNKGLTALEQPAELNGEERSILHILHDRPHTADELLEKLDLPFGHLYAVLINLTIKRKIEQHPGSLYSVL
jgi:DNA processing protein